MQKCCVDCYLQYVHTHTRTRLLVYHGLLNEILQSVEAACLIAAVLSLNGILQALQVVRGLFGITEKLHRRKCGNQI